MIRHTPRMFLVVLLTLLGLPFVATGPAAAAPISTAGTDFWITFGPNYSTPDLTLFIAGEADTTGTIAWPDGTSTAYAVTAGSITTVAVPSATESIIGGPGSIADGVFAGGVHITAAAPVTVYGLNSLPYASDAFLSSPTAGLGTRYRAIAPSGAYGTFRMNVLGTVDGTTVTVTPQSILGAHAAGVPYYISLNAGQVYTVTGPISGTLVTSDQPVAAFANGDCITFPGGACDHITEQLWPTNEWGTSFLLVRFPKTSGGDPVQVVADTDGTVVTVDGVTVATLDAGQSYQAELMTAGGNTGTLVTTSNPALVFQYLTNGQYPYGATTVSGDPASLLVPPYQQFLSRYTVTTPATGFVVNGINVTVPTAAIGTLLLDGASVDPAVFAPIGATGFSSAQLSVTPGTHSLTGGQPFGVVSYGVNDYDSYAYPGGALLSPVAAIASLTIDAGAPTAAWVGETVCIPGTVLDTDGLPVAGVRVDLSVTGANAGAVADSTTDDAGLVSVCYAGTAGGADTVTLTAGTASDATAVTWTAPVAPTFTDGTVGAMQAGVPFADAVAATGVPTPTLAITAGALPAGLTFDPATGAISGTPTTPGPYSVTITATNMAGFVDLVLTGEVAGAPPVFTDTTLGPLQVGVAVSDAVLASGTAPVTYAVTAGSLPAGLTLNVTTGAITGTPTVAGAFVFTVTATNLVGSVSVEISGQVAAAVSAATVPTATAQTGFDALRLVFAAGALVLVGAAGIVAARRTGRGGRRRSALQA